MELHTANVKPGLVYSDADREGNAGAFNPADCPCEKLYEQIPPTSVLNPFTNKSGLEPTRFEEMSEDVCYCATYRSTGGLDVLRDATTGTVPYGFQEASRIEIDFTGSGSAGGVVGLLWAPGSLSSAEVPGLVGRNENKYPKGWQLIATGVGGAESGILPQDISDHHLKTPVPEGYNSYNRTTKLFPFSGRAVYRKSDKEETPWYLSNPSNQAPYKYKDCCPAISISSFQYPLEDGIYNVSLHECNSSNIALCMSGLHQPGAPPVYRDSEWKLKLVSDGVEFVRIVIDEQEYSDGDILPLSLKNNASSWTDTTLTAYVAINDGLSYMSSFAYGSFASGSGVSELEGEWRPAAGSFCGWASGLGGPSGTSEPYSCQELGIGSCRAGGQYISPSPPSGATTERGYPQALIATTTVNNSAEGGGIFLISGGSSLLADDYYQADFGGNVDFIMGPSYCSYDPNTGPADFLSSGGGIADTITGAGYWFKKGEPFTVWLSMSGTQEWTSQRMERVSNVHSKLPRFTQISILGDPTGTMVDGLLQYKSFGSKPPLPIASEPEVHFYEFRYQSPNGQSIEIPEEEGVLINFPTDPRTPPPFSMKLTPVEDLLHDIGSTETNTSSRDFAVGDYSVPPYMRYAPYVERQWTNELLQTRGLLEGAPVDLAPMFSGDPIAGGSFAGWSGLAENTNRNLVLSLLTKGDYALNGYSGYNDAYRGVHFLPYTASLSGCEELTQLDDTFWCTGEAFSIFLSGELNLGTPTYIPGTTVLSSSGNITQTAAVVRQRGVNLALPFHERADYGSFSGFESGALAGKVLGATQAISAGYHGSVYHVPVGLFLANGNGNFDNTCGTFPHYMLNWDARAHELNGAPWYHSETNLVSKIESALPADARLITGISSYAEHFNFLEDISVASCKTAAATMASTTNPTLAVAVASFWAYDELTGGLNFPGFTSHDPSAPLQVHAGLNYFPYYMPLWGAE